MTWQPKELAKVHSFTIHVQHGFQSKKVMLTNEQCSKFFCSFHTIIKNAAQIMRFVWEKGAESSFYRRSKTPAQTSSPSKMSKCFISFIKKNCKNKYGSTPNPYYIIVRKNQEYMYTLKYLSHVWIWNLFWTIAQKIPNQSSWPDS